MRFSALALALLLAACGGRTGGSALEVVVEAPTSVEADCVEVTALSSAGVALDATRFPRAGKTELRVAVFPGGELDSSQVTLEAAGFKGPACDELSARSERKTVLFAPGIGRVTLTLGPLPPPAPDGGVGDDGGLLDAGMDAGQPDAGLEDGGVVDAGSFDAGETDAGGVDSGTPDSGSPDAGTPDAGTPDAGPPDAGAPDASVDAGLDAGPFDDGGCGPPKDAGASCGVNGVCTLQAQCAPAFPYTPSNFNPAALTNIAPAADLDCDTTFDSTNFTFSNNFCGQPRPTVVALVQDGGVELLALVNAGLTLRTGRTLTLIGDRPVAFAVFGDATIAGTILAQSGDGLDCSRGRGTNGLAGSTGSGGGGAGFGGFGGDGGAASSLGGAGGRPFGTPELVPLTGGCPGGAGGNGSGGSAGGLGGSGGGAVQLSVAGTLSVTGRIGARGAGGRRGNNNLGGGAGGGGGGSGGGVLLEAQVLRVFDAVLTANGGGGGQGGGTSNLGVDGDPGRLDTATPAAGGDQDPPNFPGFGGTGGAGTTAAANGMNQRQSGGGGGGGGGAVGRIRLNGRGACLRDGGVSSPPATGCP